MPLFARFRATVGGFLRLLLGLDRYDRWREGILLVLSRRADRKENNRHCVPGPCILVVSEGSGPHFYRELLEWLVEHEPALRSRIRLGHLPRSFPRDARVLHAWVPDPVRERSPATFRQLADLEGSARRAGAHIIHPGRVLSHSLRHVQFERLSEAGVRSPRVVGVEPGFARHLGGLRLPIMVRRPWGHGAAMVRLDTEAAVAGWAEAEGGAVSDWVAAEYIDVRSPDGYFRKYRYLMAGHRGTCRHLIISPNWEVRPHDRLQSDGAITEELGFVGAPCAHHEAFDAARRALEFDIAAFDFSYTPEGEMVVWEVNPYPDLSRPRGRPGQYLTEALEKTNQMMADFYRQALAEAEPLTVCFG